MSANANVESPIRPTKSGLEVDMKVFEEIRLTSGGKSLWNDKDNRDNLLFGEGSGLGAFFAKFVEHRDDVAVLERRIGGREFAARSTPISARGIPEPLKKEIKKAFEEFHAKAADPKATEEAKEFIESLRMADPKDSPELYRLYRNGGEMRLLVVWGCVRKGSAHLPPLDAINKIPTYRTGPVVLLRTLAALMALCLLLMALILAWPWLDKAWRESAWNPWVAHEEKEMVQKEKEKAQKDTEEAARKEAVIAAKEEQLAKERAKLEEQKRQIDEDSSALEKKKRDFAAAEEKWAKVNAEVRVKIAELEAAAEAAQLAKNDLEKQRQKQLADAAQLKREQDNVAQLTEAEKIALAKKEAMIKAAAARLADAAKKQEAEEKRLADEREKLADEKKKQSEEATKLANEAKSLARAKEEQSAKAAELRRKEDALSTSLPLASPPFLVVSPTAVVSGEYTTISTNNTKGVLQLIACDGDVRNPDATGKDSGMFDKKDKINVGHWKLAFVPTDDRYKDTKEEEVDIIVYYKLEPLGNRQFAMRTDCGINKLNLSIDWGDGKRESLQGKESVKHPYKDSGQYKIRIIAPDDRPWARKEFTHKVN